MVKPRISVIIATFNAAKTLKDCLESLIKQKDSRIEILTIDGNSTDGTQAILTEYSSHIDLIISEPDRGIYDAWNKGIAIAHGEWILFIGADDLLESDALSKYLDFLDKNDTTKIDYICAKNTLIAEKGKTLKIFGEPWRWSKFRRTMKIAHVASLHKRSLFQDVGMFDLMFPICGDYELLLRKRNKLRSMFIDTLIARMRIGGKSDSLDAVCEAHRIRKLHSSLSLGLLYFTFVWQVFLFLQHRIITTIRIREFR